MKNFAIVFFIIFFLIAGIAYYAKKNTTQEQNLSGMPTPSVVNNTPYCSPQDLQTGLNLSPGAGNIYGTFTIKNISGTTCQIIGNNFITANYDMQTINNIKVEHIGIPETQIFQVAPNQTIYSQVHYPNGPQCSTGIKTAKVIFKYAVSPIDTVSFDQQGLTICDLATDITTIQIWNMSSEPITP